MLVIVEDRDLHALAQLRLDHEAFWRLDVLQVDAPEGRLERGDDVDELVRVGLVDLDIEHIDAGKLAEQAALAFHDGLAGERTDIAQAQHGRAIGDYGDQVSARCQVRSLERIVLDRQACGRHSRGVGQREVALGGHVFGGQNGDLPGGREAMVVEGGLDQEFICVWF